MERATRVIIYNEHRTRNNIVRFLEKTKCVSTTSRVNDTTRKELIKSVGAEGFMLFHYYVSKQNLPNFLFIDEIAASGLGLSIRKIASIRRKLINTGWFIQYNEYYDKIADEFVIRTILGRDNIKKYIKNKPTREENLDEFFGSEKDQEDIL